MFTWSACGFKFLFNLIHLRGPANQDRFNYLGAQGKGAAVPSNRDKMFSIKNFHAPPETVESFSALGRRRRRH